VGGRKFPKGIKQKGAGSNSSILGRKGGYCGEIFYMHNILQEGLKES